LIQKKNTNGNLAGGPEVEEGGNKKTKRWFFFLENVRTFRENVGQHFHGKRCKILMKHLGKMLNLTFSLQKCCRTLPGKMLVQHFRWKMLQHFLMLKHFVMHGAGGKK
jgi:hypothetical protein